MPIIAQYTRGKAKRTDIGDDVIQQIIEQVLRDWAHDWIKYRKKYAQEHIGSDTGSLHSSFYSDLKKTSDAVAQAMFVFNTYARFYDFRRMQWTTTPPWDQPAAGGDKYPIEKWIKRKGVERFIAVYKRKHKYVPKSQDALVRKIAWSIRISYIKKGRFTRKKKNRWIYRKAVGKGVNDLYDLLFDALSETALDQLKHSLAA